MALVTQLVVRPENKPGELATICSEMAKMAVNITAIMASGDEGNIRMLVNPLPAAQRVLENLKVSYQAEDAVAVRVNDRPGALGRVTRKLADAGININYAYGSIVKGEERALIVLGVSDVKKAAELV